MDEDPLVLLVKEQLARFQDQLISRLKTLEANQVHYRELTDFRIKGLSNLQDTVVADIDDHEKRIRSLNDSAVASRTWQSLFLGGSTIASITALVRSFFGG